MERYEGCPALSVNKPRVVGFTQKPMPCDQNEATLAVFANLNPVSMKGDKVMFVHGI